MMDLRRTKGKKVCVAVSGGADSTALLFLLKREEKKVGYTLSALTCEHGVRGEESEKDVALVKELCEKWNIPLFVFQENCPLRAETQGVSLETACRDFRRECYQKLVDEKKADLIATAHHADDQAETVLFRLARGTSLSGVRGIRPYDGYFIRPFYDTTKAEILAFVKENGISYRDDQTNFERDATRNKIRLDVLPELEKAVNGATRSIARFSRSVAEDDEFLFAESEKLVGRGAKKSPYDTGLKVAICDADPLFKRACLTAMKEAGVEKDYGSAHLDALCQLRNARTGTKADLHRITAVREYGKIAFYYPDGAEITEEIALKKGVNLFPPYEIVITESPEEGALRADGKLLENARIRRIGEGDEIEKFGGGRKSLKKYLSDKKIPSAERKTLPVIVSEENEVLCVCGVEISEKLRVKESTEEILYILTRIGEN